MDNLNIYLNRLKPYVTKGRNQTEEESVEFGLKIIDILNQNHINYTNLDADTSASNVIVDYLKGKNNFILI